MAPQALLEEILLPWLLEHALELSGPDRALLIELALTARAPVKMPATTCLAVSDEASPDLRVLRAALGLPQGGEPTAASLFWMAAVRATELWGRASRSVEEQRVELMAHIKELVKFDMESQRERLTPCQWTTLTHQYRAMLPALALRTEDHGRTWELSMEPEYGRRMSLRWAPPTLTPWDGVDEAQTEWECCPAREIFLGYPKKQEEVAPTEFSQACIEPIIMAGNEGEAVLMLRFLDQRRGASDYLPSQKIALLERLLPQHCPDRASLAAMKTTARLWHDHIFRPLDNHKTILHMAAECGNADILEWLLQQDCTIDLLDESDDAGNTPLLSAAAHGFGDCVRLLVDATAGDQLYLLNRDGDGVLTLLARHDPREAIAVLTQCRTFFREDNGHAGDIDGYDPYHDDFHEDYLAPEDCSAALRLCLGNLGPWRGGGPVCSLEEWSELGNWLFLMRELLALPAGMLDLSLLVGGEPPIRMFRRNRISEFIKDAVGETHLRYPYDHEAMLARAEAHYGAYNRTRLDAIVEAAGRGEYLFVLPAGMMASATGMPVIMLYVWSEHDDPREAALLPRETLIKRALPAGRPAEACPDLLAAIIVGLGDSVFETLGHGATIMHQAAKCGNVEALSMLLDCPLAVDALAMSNSRGRTPLFVCAKHSSYACLEHILDRTDGAGLTERGASGRGVLGELAALNPAAAVALLDGKYGGRLTRADGTQALAICLRLLGTDRPGAPSRLPNLQAWSACGQRLTVIRRLLSLPLGQLDMKQRVAGAPIIDYFKEGWIAENLRQAVGDRYLPYPWDDRAMRARAREHLAADAP